MHKLRPPPKSTLTDDMKSELSQNLDELDIPIETQEKLIQKILNGEIWDSMKKENITAFNNMEFHFTPNNSVKRMVFEDGSVLQQSVDFNNSTVIRGFTENKNMIQPYSAMRTTYENVKISVTNGLSGGGFYANYVIDWNAHNDGILSVRDPYCNVVGGDYSEMSLTLNRSFEDYSKRKPAEATYSVHITYLSNFGGAETLILKMYVGNDRMVYGRVGEVSINY